MGQLAAIPSRTGFILAGACLVAVIAGCVEPAAPPVRLHVELDGAASAPPPALPGTVALYAPGEQVVRLTGALNEVLDFRLLVAAEGTVDVEVGGFEGSRGRQLTDNVSLFRIYRVGVDRWPGWHIKQVPPGERVEMIDDALVPARAPRGGLPAKIGADRPLAVWVDVRIPRGTAPGVYSAPLDIRVNGQVVRTLRIDLTVWPFVLPDSGMPEAVADVDHQAVFRHHVQRRGRPCAPDRIMQDHPARRELEGALAATMRLLRSHRVSGHLPNLYPVFKVHGDTRIEVDWTDYDRVVRGFLDGSAYHDRVAARSWRIPFDRRFPPPPRYGAMQSATYSRLLTEYLANAAAHFAENGWLERAYVRLPYADRMSPVAQEATDHFGYLAHHADARLSTLSALFPQDASPAGWCGFRHRDLGDAVDIWAPAGQFLDPETLDRDPTGRLWMTVDRPPFTGSLDVRAAAADVRVLPWQASDARAEALYLGLINDWPVTETGIVDPQDCIGHDPDVLIYPGAPMGLFEPIPSVRLKRLRRGMQDAAYIALLRARGQGHIAATLTESLVGRWGVDAYGAHCADGRPTAWARDVELWESARQIMADELLSDLTEEGDSVPDTLRWRRFMEDSRSVRFDIVGVRVRRAGSRPEHGVEVECTVAIHNGRRTPLGGKLAFEQLPVGWSGVPAQRFVAPVPPGGTRYVVLAAVAGSLTWETNGIRYLPMVFEDEGGGTWRLRARMAHVSAEVLPGPITLDGDLSDWPTGGGNYASDLVLVTGEDSGDTSGRHGRPRSETLCFVGQHGNTLYFGVRAELSAGGRSLLVERRAAALDDLVPTGEDAVEILLDPTNAGSASPGDVYRIVIGAGGAFWEHGVATDPPTGPKRQWIANIRHAVRVQDDHWSAEVELPLIAMPEAFRHQVVWGLNICRYDFEHHEYANWSAAVGNVYNPQSFGNLTVP